MTGSHPTTQHLGLGRVLLMAPAAVLLFCAFACALVAGYVYETLQDWRA